MKIKWWFMFPIILVMMTMQAQYIDMQSTDSIDSHVLNESRNYIIYLPEGYDHPKNLNTHYPVIYVLDGEKKGEITQSIYAYLANNFKPMIFEAIIVGIHQKDRFYELTPHPSKTMHDGTLIESNKKMGGANKFLKFIQQELHPRIKQNYRTNTYKGIIGHSLGGLFVLNAVTENPTYFSSAISIDPSLWWDNGYIMENFQKVKSTIATQLVLATAKSTADVQNQLVDQLHKKIRKQNLFTQYKVIHEEDKNHHTIVISALEEGFMYILKDESFLKIKELENVEGIKAYYGQRSSELNTDLSISYSRWLRYAKLMEKLNMK